jgi:predicted PurR-regulated permease PerM
MEKVKEVLKVVLGWTFAVIGISSLALNLFLLGFVYMDREMMKEQGHYIVYRDSTQLVIMDKMVQKYYGSSSH